LKENFSKQELQINERSIGGNKSTEKIQPSAANRKAVKIGIIGTADIDESVLSVDFTNIVQLALR